MSALLLSPHLRPREKAIGRGVNSLSESELLALVLNTSGRKGEDVLSLAGSLLRKYGSLYGLSLTTLPDLLSVPGIGKAKALSILSAFELAKRASKEEAKPPRYSPKGVLPYVKGRLSTGREESCFLLFLDREDRPVGSSEVFGGGRKSVALPLRKALSAVLRSGASRFVLIHDHPSGRVLPSKEDILFTAVLSSRAEGVGLELFDHLIVSGSEYFSFAESALLRGKGKSGDSASMRGGSD